MFMKNRNQLIRSFDRKWGTPHTSKYQSPNKITYRISKSFSKTNNEQLEKDKMQKKIKTEHFDSHKQKHSQTKQQLKYTTPTQPHSTKLNILSIEETEAKIDGLIQQKLKLLVMVNKRKICNRGKNSQIDNSLNKSILKYQNQIEQLINTMRKIPLSIPSNNDEKINEANIKINVIEKVMVQKQMQSKQRKNSYSKLSFNTTYDNYYSSCLSFSRLIKQVSQPNLEKPKIKPNDLKIPFNSTNQFFYKIPKQDDYLKYRKKQIKSNDQKQLIIKDSSYRSSYRNLKVPLVPSLSCSQTRLNITPSKKHYVTSYKQSFLPVDNKVLNNKIDYKQFDSYQNKIKNMSINYEKSKSTELNKNNSFTQTSKMQKVNFNQHFFNNPELINFHSCQLKLKTSNKIDYDDIDVRERKICIVKPKNNKINLLRTSYGRMLTKSMQQK